MIVRAERDKSVIFQNISSWVQVKRCCEFSRTNWKIIKIQWDGYWMIHWGQRSPWLWIALWLCTLEVFPRQLNKAKKPNHKTLKFRFAALINNFSSPLAKLTQWKIPSHVWATDSVHLNDRALWNQAHVEWFNAGGRSEQLYFRLISTLINTSVVQAEGPACERHQQMINSFNTSPGVLKPQQSGTSVHRVKTESRLS